MGIIDSNFKNSSKLILGIIAFFGLLIFNQWYEKNELRADKKIKKVHSIGKVYGVDSGENFVEAKVVFYLNGRKKRVSDAIPVYDESLIGRCFSISYPEYNPNDIQLKTDHEIKDTSEIINSGFKLVTKHRFDIPTGEYVAYKVFQ